MNRIIFSVFILAICFSCRRGSYVCECNSTNTTFQNVYHNATASEADEYCEAAQELYSPGHINLECHAFELEQD